MDCKMIIVIRKDIKISAGKMAAQVAHAAVNCTLLAKKRSSVYFDQWYEEGQKKVVVKVKDLAELFQIKASAEAAGLVVSLITDAGHTELPPGTVTCLGIGPAPESQMDRVTGHLGLA